MGNLGKRKRDSLAGDDAVHPPVKTQVLDDSQDHHDTSTTSKKDGMNRQKKSERKKKNSVQAKANAARNKQAANEHNGQVPVRDDIATGRDFVSLKKPAPWASKKEKRRSPRAIRKEAREKKIIQELDEAEGVSAKESGVRFICFVGNLPYDVTTEQVASHFVKIKPKAIRLSTDKNTGKCKGFAFLEFDNYDKMKTCLKLYHHSIFEPDQTQEAAGAPGADSKPRLKGRGRKINVELTAGGGGGKSSGRRDKIRAKNEKLNEERARDWEQKKQDEIEKARTSKGRKASNPSSGANNEEVNTTSNDQGDIHPSRLSRVQV